ncbi:hypothetical protein FA13DRAFT_330295 [Coprinellus micaceus]|uniref:Uncharacterized protein n=1 Tax=Coprinellus micaceus TaxID=71717 RepID=A0A4Y7TD50_COPMI|nr:hypothetical protein FA13DRAFT_330295 [Coprinellus micaceus]
MFASSTQALLGARKALHVDSHRQRIDQRLAELQAEMRALKTCRNFLSSPMNLPPEILSHIFLLVYLDCQNQPPPYWGEQQRWIWIMHVCVHWRAVAFGCADLWTTPTFSHPALTEFQLSQAGQAPLTIEFTPSHHKGQKILDILREVLSQTDRLRSIDIERTYGQHPRLPRGLLEGCSGRAPHLEHVRVHDSSLAVRQGVELPPQFLAGGAPVLKSLELHGCRISTWNALFHLAPV